jgi:hypothetical protein
MSPTRHIQCLGMIPQEAELSKCRLIWYGCFFGRCRENGAVPGKVWRMMPGYFLDSCSVWALCALLQDRRPSPRAKLLASRARTIGLFDLVAVPLHLEGSFQATAKTS